MRAPSIRSLLVETATQIHIQKLTHTHTREVTHPKVMVAMLMLCASKLDRIGTMDIKCAMLPPTPSSRLRICWCDAYAWRMLRDEIGARVYLGMSVCVEPLHLLLAYVRKSMGSILLSEIHVCLPGSLLSSKYSTRASRVVLKCVAFIELHIHISYTRANPTTSVLRTTHWYTPSVRTWLLSLSLSPLRSAPSPLSYLPSSAKNDGISWINTPILQGHASRDSEHIFMVGFWGTLSLVAGCFKTIRYMLKAVSALPFATPRTYIFEVSLLLCTKYCIAVLGQISQVQESCVSGFT